MSQQTNTSSNSGASVYYGYCSGCGNFQHSCTCRKAYTSTSTSVCTGKCQSIPCSCSTFPHSYTGTNVFYSSTADKTDLHFMETLNGESLGFVYFNGKETAIATVVFPQVYQKLLIKLNDSVSALKTPLLIKLRSEKSDRYGCIVNVGASSLNEDKEVVFKDSFIVLLTSNLSIVDLKNRMKVALQDA